MYLFLRDNVYIISNSFLRKINALNARVALI